MPHMSPRSNPCIINRSSRSSKYAQQHYFSVAQRILGSIDAEHIAEVGIISKTTLT